MNQTEILDQIWTGDRLGRRREANIIQQYLILEIAALKDLGREHSIVLGIDSPYGLGKSWFLERLGKQLELSHPVARVDAWADDVGDEPLIAFMAAIDDALAPYLSKSKKLGDRMAAVKAAALPVMGKLVSGALIKALSKVAGDGIEDKLGKTIEDAVRIAREDIDEKDHGAAAQAMETALDKLGEEIDSLVDRRGAAMLAAYRQRKESRNSFRSRMRDLVAAIHGEADHRSTPLVIIIDELDRCRPNYAIRTLEEIKHFFDVPNVVFILGLHGEQLSKSVKAIYGNEFDGQDYLRRFFTKRYQLRGFSIVEMCAAVFEEWKINESIFSFPELTVSTGYVTTKPRMIGIMLAQWSVTPRELLSVLDGLRLFISGWEHPDPIEPMALLSLLVQMVRGQNLNFVQPNGTDHVLVKGLAMHMPSARMQAENFSINSYLNSLKSLAWNQLPHINNEMVGPEPARNYLLKWLQKEWQSRSSRSPNSPPHQSHLADYIPRISDLARFIDKPID